MSYSNQPEILTVEELFSSQYVVPLYQRNFSWGEEEIKRLLQDIYESMKSRDQQYFVGSLVVIRRRNNAYEVIDGQQRLTVLSLMSYVLQIDVRPDIQYDSRPEVEQFLKQVANGIPISQKDVSISHFSDAIDILIEEISRLESESNKEEIASMASELENTDFRSVFGAFIKKHVCLVRDIMPQDTDVASYFEIMNNRGEQLQEHEIIKGLLLEKLTDSPALSQICSTIWDACSQMNERIQKSFPKAIRTALFGNNYDDLALDDQNYKELLEGINIGGAVSAGAGLAEILKPDFRYDPANNNPINDEDKPEEYNEEAIIDFPNFLMHVMRLYYGNDPCVLSSELEGIPLHDKYLLKVFRLIQGEIDPVEFIYRLLRCRTLFDRYVVMTNFVNDNDEEGREWTLLKPQIKESSGRTQLKFENSFDQGHQDMIIKALSCIQVSHPSRYYKNYLQAILEWFKSRKSLSITGEEYLRLLNRYIYNELIEKSSCYFGLKEYNSDLQGTKVSRVTFDYLDYMLWRIHVNRTDTTGEEKEWALIKNIKDFRFQYWNSVEHHYPQKRKEEFESENVTDFDLNCLGNLFLIGKSTNSRLSDKNPEDKAKLYSDSKSNLAPNRQLIYTITISKGWKLDSIKQHLNFIETVFSNASVILL